MSDIQPKVSIGLAVFNGEKYLREAIESILAQTFTDFELIISDNASTDRTEEICRAYATQDPRIRYVRNATNIGGANNENQTFHLSRGQYFRLAAHDDVLAPELIEKCVEVLDQDLSVVLCDSININIDENGQEIGILDRNIATSIKPCKRFRELANWNHHCEESYGLIRSSIIRKTDLLLNYSDADRTWLAELSLSGRFYKIPKPLFYRRYHSGQSTRVFQDPIDRMAWFNPSSQSRIKSLIQLRRVQFSHYLRIIYRADLAFYEYVYCYWHTLCWLRIIQQETYNLRSRLFLTLKSWKLGKTLLPRLFFFANKNRPPVN
jgi:glycosyltransferase involved in cell wall biosynthesis